MALVTIKCPQGIERLTELGEAVARSGDWNRPDAPAALVGLWLSCQIARAELRGSLEVVGERLQLDVSGEPEGDAAKALDRTLAGWWDAREVRLRAEGYPALNQVDLGLSLQSDAGAIPLAVIGAGVIVATVQIGAAAWAITALSKEAIRAINDWQVRSSEERKSDRDTAELLEYSRQFYQAQHTEAAAGRDPAKLQLHPAVAQRVADIGKRQAIATANITAKPTERKAWWESLDDAAPWLAVAVLGVAWLAKR